MCNTMQFSQLTTVAMLLCGALMLGLVGCEQSSSAPTAATPLEPSDPTALFEQIVKRVKWDIQGGLDTPNVRSFVYPSATVFIEESVQDSQIFPPDEQHEYFRGSITIASRVTYHARQQIEEPEPTLPSRGLVQDFSADADEDALDASVFNTDTLFSESNTKQAEQSAATRVREVVGRHEDSDVQVYEFAFRDDLWQLETSIDEETNSGMKRTIEYALSTQ